MLETYTDEGSMAAQEPVTSRYFARFGSFILRLSTRPNSDISLHRELVDAIRRDMRVRRVDPGAMDPNWSSNETMFPDRTGEEGTDDLLSGRDHFHTVRFSDAIMFEVQVPPKNQPVIHGEKASADTYYVAWDGCTAVVAWPREANERLTTVAGGQVVVEILKVAVESIGHKLYVQACSPGCRNLFAHKDMTVEAKPADDFRIEMTAAPSLYEPVGVSIAGVSSPLRVAEAIHDELKVPAADFAVLKNTSRRILNLEVLARAMTGSVLSLDYISLQLSRRNVLVRMRQRLADGWAAVRGGGRGRETKILIASLWLAMARIEGLQHTLSEEKAGYEDSISSWADKSLFEGDLKDDDLRVASIDTGFARAAIESQATRMDNRVIVWATAGGAIAGAIIGGLTAAVAGAAG